MNTNRIILLALSLLMFGVTANAQDAPKYAATTPVVNPQSFPGQFWTDLGNLSPVEHNNLTSASYVEQGVTIFRTTNNTITPYASFGITADQKGYDWNNRLVGTAGIKYNRYLKKGIVSFGGAYAYEDRFLSGQKKGGFAGQVTYWFGWQGVGNQASRFPGSTWGAAGWLSPVEYHNFIYMQYIKQGVVAKRFGTKNAIVPYVDLTTNVDTSRFDWENRAITGTGVEFTHLHGNSLLEIGAGYVHEYRFISNESAGGLALFAKFWFGWNPIRGGRH